MLFQGISYFRNQDYGPAGEKFEKVLRDARCIGEGKLEARALGNLATVSELIGAQDKARQKLDHRLLPATLSFLSCGRLPIGI